MIDSTSASSLFAAPSFEVRSLTGPYAFLEAGGHASSVFLAKLTHDNEQLDSNVHDLKSHGFNDPASLDRFSSKALWEWTWRSVLAASPDVLIDATCFPRELLGILLFALSARRDRLDRVRILYTAPDRYITTLADVSAAEKWLSRGIRVVRSILGYPGKFASDRRRHVVALAGHEIDRLLEIISYLEPTRLSISCEQQESSTVADANLVSDSVRGKLRESIGLPDYGEVVFYADSIDRTFFCLKDMLADSIGENVALVAMNTKLSFIGAALCALHLRHIRMIYAVPIEYNPRYSEGAREVQQFDITDLLKTSATTPARTFPAE